jgi:hypothetical protein
MSSSSREQTRGAVAGFCRLQEGTRTAAVLKLLAVGLLVACSFAQGLAAGSWKIQYFYDRDDSKFIINDFQFVNATHGYASGVRESSAGLRPMLISTEDGGKTWIETYPPSVPTAIFFTTETSGWMAAESGIWQTPDSGKSWRKLSEVNGVIRLWFLNEKRGFAVGYPKLMKETRNGGVTWTDIKAAKDVTGKPEKTRYTAIAFEGNIGIVAGVSEPSRPGPESPAWVDPEEAAGRRLWPTLSIGVRTSDAGEHWAAQTAPIFGITTRLRLNGDVGMSVVRYAESFEVPSEVYAVNAAGSVQSVYKEKKRIVTDAGWLGPQAVLVAVEPPGKLNQLPFPGKIHVLESLDLSGWTEMDVNYKAFGGNAMFAIVDEGNAWIATDTGMILHLVP